MPRDEAIAARKNRNAALVEAMVMAAIADGSIAQREMETLIRRVIERPEFEGTRPEELNALIEGSAQKLSHAKKLEDVLASLRQRLPDHKNRLLAFGLAAAVALADRKTTREELGLLKTFQMGLGISENEVQDIFTAIEANQPLNEVLGEPTERLFAEVMVLVSVTDGRVSANEASAIVEALAGDPVFRTLSMDRAQLFVRDAMQSLSQDGMDKRLVVMANSLTTHAQRVKAYGLAARVAQAGGNRAPELHVLELLQATFGLADDEVAKIKREA
ncbi:MAG: TerB family tellurite resistance protein [Archangiaceae bacterium]|nr:TerB family tellurite resistance protein [Archangiaceae bacterium]